MSKADTVELQFLDSISSINAIDAVSVGKLLTPILFAKSEVALYSSDTIKIFGEATRTNSNWLLLIRIISLVESLANENIIWLVSQSECCNQTIYYESAEYINKGQVVGELVLASGTKLYLNNNPRLVDNKSMLPLSLEITGDVVEHVSKILCSYVYPTQLFAQYQNRGYTTPTDYSLKQAIRANRLSLSALIISLIVAVASPIISHKYVETTINSLQFHELCDSISLVGKKSVNQPCFLDVKKTN